MGLKRIVVLLLVFTLTTGCMTKRDSSVELFNYPEVSVPVPSKATLNRTGQGGQVEQIVLSKADIGSLVRVLRAALDVSLGKQQPQAGSGELSLNIEYDKPAELELIVEGRPVSFETQKLNVNLDNKLVLLEAKGQMLGFNGLNISDDFRKFMQEYNRDNGFPLPPARHDTQAVEQLPLAKPGEAKVRLLPPSQPREKLKGF